MINSKKLITRFFVYLIVIMLFANIAIPIASARASHYIHSYSSNISAGTNGNVTVSFSITGTGRMTSIGSTRIEIRENGTLVATYIHTTTDGMMGSNAVIHSGTVTYKGVAGRSYSAIVSFRAGNNTGWDDRAMQTNTVIAK